MGEQPPSKSHLLLAKPGRGVRFFLPGPALVREELVVSPKEVTQAGLPCVPPTQSHEFALTAPDLFWRLLESAGRSAWFPFCSFSADIWGPTPKKVPCGPFGLSFLLLWGQKLHAHQNETWSFHGNPSMRTWGRPTNYPIARDKCVFSSPSPFVETSFLSGCTCY